MATQRATNFPGAFNQPLTVRGQSILLNHPGAIWWVDSNSIHAGRKGTFDTPFATVAQALGACLNGRGDIIMAKANHAEAIIAAGGWTFTSGTHNNVRIIGQGQGASRPAITFSTAVSASVLIGAAGVSIENIIGVAGINALTQPFDVRAAGVSLDIEWQDASTVLEALRAILTTAAADKLRVSLRYMGQTGGSSCVNAIRLVGVDEALIDINFYGKASTAVVEMLTTACTGVRVAGDVYNASGVGKVVVDTVGGSIWWAEVMDGAQGYRTAGGSAAAIASPNKPLVASKVIPAATVLTTGASPFNLFLVTGDVMARVFATVQTGLTSTGTNGTLSVGVTGNTAVFLPVTTVDGTNFPTGAVWAGDTAPTVKAKVLSLTALNWAPIAGSANIIATIATNSMTAGALTFYCQWFPLSSNGNVVGA